MNEKWDSDTGSEELKHIRLEECAIAVTKCIPITKEEALEHITYVGDIADSVEDSVIALFDYYILEELAKAYKNIPCREDDISTLKKRIKYCKNPLEKKNLQRELNRVYKSRKKGYKQ